METALIILASLCVLAGVMGTIIPGLPGVPVVYAGILILHFGKGGVFGTGWLIFFGILTAVTLVVDYLLPVLGARFQGASRAGIFGSFIGTIAGFLVLSIPGMILGMFLGAVAGELYAGKKAGKALKAGLATFLGSVASAVLKIGLALVMAVYFGLGLVRTLD